MLHNSLLYNLQRNDVTYIVYLHNIYFDLLYFCLYVTCVGLTQERYLQEYRKHSTTHTRKEQHLVVCNTKHNEFMRNRRKSYNGRFFCFCFCRVQCLPLGLSRKGTIPVVRTRRNIQRRIIICKVMYRVRLYKIRRRIILCKVMYCVRIYKIRRVICFVVKRIVLNTQERYIQHVRCQLHLRRYVVYDMYIPVCCRHATQLCTYLTCGIMHTSQYFHRTWFCIPPVHRVILV